MGYKVKCYPRDAAAGYLERGHIATEGMGTYYNHPGPAVRAAEAWISRNRGSRAEVLTYRDEAVVGEFHWLGT